MDEDEIVVVTASSQLFSIRIADGTRFRNEVGTSARKTDLRAGDRVAVDVHSIGGSHLAEEVRFARPDEARSVEVPGEGP